MAAGAASCVCATHVGPSLFSLKTYKQPCRDIGTSKKKGILRSSDVSRGGIRTRDLTASERTIGRFSLTVRASDTAASVTSSSSSPPSDSPAPSYSPPSSFDDDIDEPIFPDVVSAGEGAAAALFSPILRVDHYGQLGCSREALIEEIVMCFQARCTEIRQDSTLTEDEAMEKLEVVKRSFEVLGTDEKRRLYDWGLLTASRPDDVYTWPYEADITQRIVSSDKPPKNTFDIDDSEGDKPWVYFFVGWFVLSIFLGLFVN